MRDRLKTAIEARVLWRSGEPVCVALAAVLDGAGVKRFGSDAVRVIGGHADTCAECQERRDTRLEPSTLFGAIPFIVVPMLLKMKVAHALSESGVPMDGSEAAAAEGGSHTGRHRRGGRGRRLAAMGGVVVVAFVGVGVAAEEVDEIPFVETATSNHTPTSTLAASSTTSTTVAPVPSTTEGGSGPVAPPAGVVPAPSPPAVTASISVTPSSEPTRYTMGRVVARWSSTGGTSVQVTGPEGLIGTSTTGSAAVCPGRILRGDCYASARTYTYAVTVRDASGAVVAAGQRDVDDQLTIRRRWSALPRRRRAA